MYLRKKHTHFYNDKEIFLRLVRGTWFIDKIVSKEWTEGHDRNRKDRKIKRGNMRHRSRKSTIWVVLSPTVHKWFRGEGGGRPVSRSDLKGRRSDPTSAQTRHQLLYSRLPHVWGGTSRTLVKGTLGDLRQKDGWSEIRLLYHGSLPSQCLLGNQRLTEISWGGRLILIGVSKNNSSFERTLLQTP